MKITTFVLTFLISFTSFKSNKLADSVRINEIEYKDGVYFFKDKIFNGDIVDYYENETLKFRYAVLDGRLNGVAKEFFPEGEIKSERTYYMSKLYGNFTEYFPNGQIRAKFDVKLNAYGQGEIVENITIGELKKGKYKTKNFDKGIIYFTGTSGEIFETSENIFILNQTHYKIMDEDKKHTLIEVK
ncbi:MORN repeat protein [Roseivirga ehrenbergii]|uniref:Uncharacterized protein n=1 Tax=Roseivirga ehrenbergii (strain DSM 102268 / JCM 13514 / KCTC 12282 / NCIMB 14502 / KMM 6017) TaxID=279360 RepID=A0A150X755_ROSEK|nr:hypothetical protein [Roseivirga ehrenbergii]KYG74551.1 hypothetical protein MB14_04900 [Roseivirga ehrenbergii]TCL14134.1 MORN repeat protein [Roseivirga ehrenbergii]